MGLLTKLNAWWRRARRDAAPAPVARPLRSPTRTGLESEQPLDGLTLAQWLWGAGCHTPGDEDHILDLVKPFALNPAMSMLYLGAGLGGGARAIATKFATYVTALERDATLARRGMEMSTLQGMQKRAPVSVYDPETIELRAGSFDCILARQTTYALPDKEKFLGVLAHALKPRGHLLLVDYVLDPKHPAGPELDTWRRHQGTPPQLWSAAQYVNCLSHLGLDIRVTEDATDTFRRLVINGWGRMITTVNLGGLPKQHLLAVVDEAERWVRTIAALDAGALRTYRIYALAGAAGARR
jgi:SAM-dependent methyltransferase